MCQATAAFFICQAHIRGYFLRIDPLSSVPTQHLITPIPQPSRDDRWVSSLRFDPIVDDPTDVGLVVEDILDGHP